MGFDSDDLKLDRKKLIQVTGKEDHEFHFENVEDSLRFQRGAEVQKHFCQNPCVHVMHDHE